MVDRDKYFYSFLNSSLGIMCLEMKLFLEGKRLQFTKYIPMQASFPF